MMTTEIYGYHTHTFYQFDVNICTTMRTQHDNQNAKDVVIHYIRDGFANHFKHGAINA